MPVSRFLFLLHEEEEEKDSREAGEGLWGLKTGGQVEALWLCLECRGDPVTQTNNKHSGVSVCVCVFLGGVCARGEVVFLCC